MPFVDLFVQQQCIGLLWFCKTICRKTWPTDHIILCIAKYKITLSSMTSSNLLLLKCTAPRNGDRSRWLRHNTSK